MSPHRLDLRDLAERYTAAWCGQNPALVAAFYSDEGSLCVNDDPPAVGREAITQLARSFMSVFPDLRVVMNELRVQNEPEYHWTLYGTHSGPGGAAHRVCITASRNGVLDLTA